MMLSMARFTEGTAGDLYRLWGLRETLSAGDRYSRHYEKVYGFTYGKGLKK
jgi:hypothetical protein